MIEKSNDGNPYGINPEEIVYYRDNHPQAAQYTCHQFYSMRPGAASEVKCNKDTFMFEPPAPECLPGSFSTCFDSFYNWPLGFKFLVTLYNFHFYSNKFECLSTECPDPPTFDKASFTTQDNYFPGTVVEYTCDTDYSFLPEGKNTITCANNGTWTVNLGTCYSSLFFCFSSFQINRFHI